MMRVGLRLVSFVASVLEVWGVSSAPRLCLILDLQFPGLLLM